MEHNLDEFSPIVLFTHVFAITSCMTLTSLYRKIDSRKASSGGGFSRSTKPKMPWDSGLELGESL